MNKKVLLLLIIILSVPLLIAPSFSNIPQADINYSFEINGKVTGYFTSVEGIGSTTQIVEHKVMSNAGKETNMKIPGRLSWNTITLTRNLTTNMDLAKWREMVENGNIKDARGNGSIIMFDKAGNEIAKWDFTNAWPSELYQGLEEKVVVVVESIKRVK